MSSLTVGQKIGLTCLSLCVGLAILAGVSLTTIRSTDNNLKSISTDSLPGMYYISEARAKILDYEGDCWQHIGARNIVQIKAMNEEIAAIKKDLDEDLKAYEATIADADDRAKFNRIGPALNDFNRVWEQVRLLSEADKNQEAYDLFASDGQKAVVALEKLLEERVQWNKQAADRLSAESIQHAERGTQATIWVTVIALLAGGLLSFALVKSLSSTLTSAITELASGASQVAAAASQVAASSQTMAQGASSQAGSIEETSASTVEVSATAKKNSADSTKAAELVRSSEAAIENANASLGMMQESMVKISTSGEKISNIIKVIDSIAFQTNILALNAAVEAARAGEAGLGFAVVADEVRNLAQNCSQAARDTTALIEESSALSTDGRQKLELVAKAIEAITSQSKQVRELVEAVNGSSKEQTLGLDQISSSIQQIEVITQTNAASAEQTAAAAQELTAQSQTVNAVVERLSKLIGASA